MPIECKFHESKPEDTRPGDMWYARDLVDGENAEFYSEHYLSAEYKSTWAAFRPPIMVCLPNGEIMCIDARYLAADRPNPSGYGWTVRGEAPRITVHPSINCVGRYHGWLVNGVLSDDVDGRRF